MQLLCYRKPTSSIKSQTYGICIVHFYFYSVWILVLQIQKPDPRAVRGDQKEQLEGVELELEEELESTALGRARWLVIIAEYPVEAAGTP